MLLGSQAGADWDVRFTGFSLDQTKVAEGDTPVWGDPEMAPVRMAVEVGIVVRDRFPEAFNGVHRALFAARHDDGLDLRNHAVVADVLEAQGLHADEVFNHVLTCGPRDTFRAEHEAAVNDHQAFGVPTVIAGGRAVFIRLLDRPGDDAEAARLTVERCLDLVTGWPNLNEFKHTSIPH